MPNDTDLTDRVHKIELKVELWSEALGRLTTVVREQNKSIAFLHAQVTDLNSEFNPEVFNPEEEEE